MNIVVLDGHTVNPGDLAWSGLEALGNCRVFPRTEPALAVERAQEAEIVLTNKVVIGRQEMSRLPRLRYIGVLATGYNVVDVEAAAEHGIVVTNVPAYSTRSVAQMTFALILELTQHVGHHAQTVRDGRWARSADFCYWDFPLVELDGMTLGLVGFGRIGQAVAAIALACGMRVLTHTRTGGLSPVAGVEPVDLDTLFRVSDVVSLHCPLTGENRGMVNAARLSLMKPTAILINTARGPLVNEEDLAAALNAERLAGAGLDVLSAEPPATGNPLLTARNCFITPHMAWATRAARSRLLAAAVGNIAAFLAGTPRNRVDNGAVVLAKTDPMSGPLT
ncbi:MAG: D-2-hydroxyacid dehydrogenase [bacterium]